MTKMKKLLAVVLVCAIMAVCGASAFADTVRVGTTGYMYAWRGSSTAYGKAGLMDTGMNQTMTVRGGSGSIWTLELAPKGSGLVLRSPAGTYVNIYRYNQGGYYLARGSAFDYADNGRDQRVWNVDYGSATAFRLAEPNLNAGGYWYLATDASNPQPASDVIWSSGGGANRCFWAR